MLISYEIVDGGVLGEEIFVFWLLYDFVLLIFIGILEVC